MKIETLKLWENREDVELTTFLTMPDPFIPNPVFKPAIIVCPGGAYQTCPRHGNPMLADDMNVPVIERNIGKMEPNQSCNKGDAGNILRSGG